MEIISRKRNESKPCVLSSHTFTDGVQPDRMKMTLKPKYHLETVRPLEETAITNFSRYRVRSLPAAGALVREEDAEEQQMDLLN